MTPFYDALEEVLNELDIPIPGYGTRLDDCVDSIRRATDKIKKLKAVAEAARNPNINTRQDMDNSKELNNALGALSTALKELES